jgi:sugar fermentation stimulation protein A
MLIEVKPALLRKRYKRFLADVVLANNTETTIHVANTGAMTGCAAANSTIWYSTSNNKKRKYPYSWEFTQTQNNHLICVNTIRANQLVEQALNENVITPLGKLLSIRREVNYGDEKSKIDFLVENSLKQIIYIEVKSVTLLENNQGYFPDAVSTRGQKHLRELMQMVTQGYRAVLLFAVLHEEINSVKPAAHIDKKYAELMKQAVNAGVEIYAYKMQTTKTELGIEAHLLSSIPVYVA